MKNIRNSSFDEDNFNYIQNGAASEGKFSFENYLI